MYNLDNILEEINKLKSKKCDYVKNHNDDMLIAYQIGYLSALSYLEGFIGEIKEKSQNT